MSNSASNFRESILSWEQKYHDSQPELEVYLRALWKLVADLKGEKATFELFAELLETAFHSDPAPFDPCWMIYEAPADYPDEKLEADLAEDEALGYLTHTLLFQIADLRRMKGKELENEYRGFGVTSPTGHSWYNFEPTLYLSCATAILDDEGERRDVSVSWMDLENLLEMGRVYE